MSSEIELLLKTVHLQSKLLIFQSDNGMPIAVGTIQTLLKHFECSRHPPRSMIKYSSHYLEDLPVIVEFFPEDMDILFYKYLTHNEAKKYNLKK